MRNVNGQTEVMARVRRATWARARTAYDPPENFQAASETIEGAIVGPRAQQVCERIEKHTADLLDAIDDGHRLWIRGELNPREREALRQSAALVGQKLGRPDRG